MRERVRLPECEDIEHDEWFRGQVEEALESADGAELHFVPHEQVESRWAKKREELLAKNQKPANK
jgi:hypothetical protein